MRQPRLLGVTGFAQHGKDTVGRIAVSTQKYHRYAFADQLKDLALEANPWVSVEWHPPPANEVYDLRLSRLVEEGGWEGAKQNPEVRRFLQELGTGAREVLGDDVWVRALENKLVKAGRMAEGKSSQPFSDYIIVTDVRFPNEADWIHEKGGKLIRVHRPFFDNGVGTDHPSEAFVEDLPVDYTLLNEHRLSDFEYKVFQLLDSGGLAYV